MLWLKLLGLCLAGRPVFIEDPAGWYFCRITLVFPEYIEVRTIAANREVTVIIPISQIRAVYLEHPGWERQCLNKQLDRKEQEMA